MNNLFYWLTALSLGVLAVSCRTTNAPAVSESLPPLQASEFLKRTPQALLIDVRNPDEYKTEHIAGSKLIPLPELESRLAEIPKDKPLLLYCHSGRRSLQALTLLKSRGYKDLRQVEGGITAWREKGLPVEKNLP
ncbi:MAG TPA: rhodanese-like domain-containing protein [bacterium]|nr:rhodanese-like domain-containing protein [bacterium]